jgi:predicted Zn-ribbon and HTH transcriptional regulator
MRLTDVQLGYAKKRKAKKKRTVLDVVLEELSADSKKLGLNTKELLKLPTASPLRCPRCGVEKRWVTEPPSPCPNCGYRGVRVGEL